MAFVLFWNSDRLDFSDEVEWFLGFAPVRDDLGISDEISVEGGSFFLSETFSDVAGLSDSLEIEHDVAVGGRAQLG
jgi:hypothetical protein